MARSESSRIRQPPGAPAENCESDRTNTRDVERHRIGNGEDRRFHCAAEGRENPVTPAHEPLITYFRRSPSAGPHPYFCGPQRLETLATGKQIDDDEDYGHDNKDMEKAADRSARDHAEQPQHQQNYRNRI